MSGAEGKLKLTFKQRADGRTYLAKQFYQLPLQILPPHYQDTDGTAFIYLLNPSGGVLQNDRLCTEIYLEENSRVCITTPSANKFYKMQDGYARVDNQFYVKRNAVLEYLPEHNVPFADSKTYQETVFCLDPKASLIAFDVVTSGRAERGERFAYDLYASRTKIFVGEKLIACENSKIEPKQAKFHGIGVLEGYDIYGTVFFYQEGLSERLSDELRLLSAQYPDIYYGVSRMEEGLSVLKFLGKTTLETQRFLSDLWGVARKTMLRKDRVRIRKY